MAIATRWENTNVCAHCHLRNITEKQRHMSVANAMRTHQRVSPRELRFIIREATAWPWQMRWAHTNVCASCKLRIINREATAWTLPMRGNTPTCVPTVSLELSPEKPRHGCCKMRRAPTNVCANCNLRIIIIEGMAVANALGTHQCVCPL